MKKHLLLVGAACTITCLTLLGIQIFHRDAEATPESPDAPSKPQGAAQILTTPADPSATPARPSQASGTVAVPGAHLPINPPLAVHPPSTVLVNPIPAPAASDGHKNISPTAGQSSSRAQTYPAISPSSQYQGRTEEIVPVPVGARLPAALVDPAADATAEQATALDNLAEDFLNSTGTPSPPNDNTTASSESGGDGNWDSAASTANERYRALFGVDAYNAWTTTAAKEALAETP